MNTTGISRESRGKFLIFTFLSSLAKIAAASVAAEPKTMSHTPKGLVMLPRTQPTVRPGIAAGVNTARIVSASEKRNWIGP